MGRGAQTARANRLAATILLIAVGCVALLYREGYTPIQKAIDSASPLVEQVRAVQRSIEAQVAPAFTYGESSSSSSDAKPLYASEDTAPFDMVLGLSHHKTGTFQLRCLMKQFADTAGLNEPVGLCFKDNSLSAVDLMTCLDYHSANTSHPVRRPVLMKTFHGMKQICQPFGKGDPWDPCLSFMIAKPCSRRKVKWMRRPTTCSADLPPPHVRMGFFNIIRNPIDAVLSAFSFHSGKPKSEPWLFRPMNIGDLTDKLKWAGAEVDTVHKLGLGGSRRGEQAAYVDLLTALPPELGVIMEFWHSLPEVVSIARQYQVLTGHPGAFHARFEDLRDSFNDTVLEGLQHLKLGSTPEKMLEAAVAAGCDPGTWSDEQRAASNHITDGKQEGFKETAEDALMSYAPAKEILCELCIELGYQDPRCGLSEGAEWRKRR